MGSCYMISNGSPKLDLEQFYAGKKLLPERNVEAVNIIQGFDRCERGKATVVDQADSVSIDQAIITHTRQYVLCRTIVFDAQPTRTKQIDLLAIR